MSLPRPEFAFVHLQLIWSFPDCNCRDYTHQSNCTFSLWWVCLMSDANLGNMRCPKLTPVMVVFRVFWTQWKFTDRSISKPFQAQMTNVNKTNSFLMGFWLIGQHYLLIIETSLWHFKIDYHSLNHYNIIFANMYFTMLYLNHEIELFVTKK